MPTDHVTRTKKQKTEQICVSLLFAPLYKCSYYNYELNDGFRLKFDLSGN